MGYTNRNEIPEKYKWNLADIYPTVDKWEEEFKVAEKSIEEIAKFKGTLNNKKSILDCFICAPFNFSFCFF